MYVMKWEVTSRLLVLTRIQILRVSCGQIATTGNESTFDGREQGLNAPFAGVVLPHDDTHQII